MMPNSHTLQTWIAVAKQSTKTGRLSESKGGFYTIEAQQLGSQPDCLDGDQYAAKNSTSSPKIQAMRCLCVRLYVFDQSNQFLMILIKRPNPTRHQLSSHRISVYLIPEVSF